MGTRPALSVCSVRRTARRWQRWSASSATSSDRWRSDGIPPNPAGWIITTARNRAIDDLRRSTRGRELREQLGAVASASHGPGTEVRGEDGPVRDDQLRLIFTCCHPALRTEHPVALTLRLLGGLSVDEVARSFLVSELTMAKRLVRAKYKIKAAKIPYRVPDEADLPERLRSVLSVVYLIYNTGLDDPGRASCGPRQFGSLARLSSCCPTSPKWQGCSRCCCSVRHGCRPARPRVPGCSCAIGTGASGTAP
jgi:RNA polymerase sigma-70 factor (ECF subfamily)